MLFYGLNTKESGIKHFMENIILFDWLSFTSRFHSAETILDFLGLSESGLTFRNAPGHRTYKDSIIYGEIHICYNSETNPGVWVEMSGQGCREFEQHSRKSFQEIFIEIIENPKDYHISRLDVAYDDFNKKIDIKKLRKETENLNFVSKFKDPVIEYSVRSGGLTVYFGSFQSDVYMRCYDKARERHREDITDWVRWEVVLKNDIAFNFVRQVYENGETIGCIFFGLINNYIRFIIPDRSQTNLSRLKTAKWWLNWIECIDQISVYTPKNTSYNLSRCEAYGYGIAGNAIATLIDIKGVTEFCKELKKNKPKTNVKYQNLIETNGRSTEGILQFLSEKGAL